MKRLVGLTLAFAVSAHADHRARIGKGWLVDAPVKELTDYEGGLDNRVSHHGRASACLRSTVAAPTEHAVIWQGVSAERYRGKRIRVTVWVRTSDVEKAAGAFMKVLGADQKTSLAYDKQDLTGTHDWTRQEMVVDVEPAARIIWFGLGLEGAGRAWIDDVSLEVVDASVPLTDRMKKNLPLEPQDLDFEG
jgi:hypothetical protein